ncbi:MAG: hypothetical protein L0K34_04875 [Ancrocorticia sp.]|nr:hypothetical protein [Ancrocorticia sp.]
MTSDLRAAALSHTDLMTEYGVFSRRALLAQYSSREIGEFVAAGLLQRINRGRYTLELAACQDAPPTGSGYQHFEEHTLCMTMGASRPLARITSFIIPPGLFPHLPSAPYPIALLKSGSTTIQKPGWL